MTPISRQLLQGQAGIARASRASLVPRVQRVLNEFHLESKDCEMLTMIVCLANVKSPPLTDQTHKPHSNQTARVSSLCTKSTPSYLHLRMYLELCRSAVYAFLDDSLEPLDRLYHAWYASYFVSGWEHDSRRHFELRNECLTPNQRDCIHMNAKSLLLFMWWIISQPGMCKIIPFAPHLWGEQQCEAQYRITRDARHGDTNFSLFDLLHLINKAMLSAIIRMRRADDFSWPCHHKHRSFEKLHRAAQFLPEDLTLQHLIDVLHRARRDALAALRSCGVDCSWTAVPPPPPPPPAVPESSDDTSDDDGNNEDDDDPDDAWLAAGHINLRDLRAATCSDNSNDNDSDSDGEEDDVDLTDDDDDEELEADSPPVVHLDNFKEPFSARPDTIAKTCSSSTLRDQSGAQLHKQRACAFVSRHTKLPNSRARFRAPKDTTFAALP